MKLTKSTIDKLVYEGDGKEQDIRWDDILRGFGVRVYPSGQKSFVVSYRVNGRKRIMVLGKYGILTLDEARDKSKRVIVSAMDGTDSLAERQKGIRGKTISDLCSHYIEGYAKLHKKSWKEDVRRIERIIIPTFGTLKIASVTSADIAKFHHEKTISGAPYEANRIVEILSKMFKLAKLWGYFNGENPTIGIRHNKENKRDRFVTPEELPLFAEAIDKEQNIFIRAAIWLYILTGVRKTELLNAKWEDVDFRLRQLRIPETKSGKIHYVPLSEPAIDILRVLPRVNENKYILVGNIEGASLVNISKPWKRICKSAKVEGVRLHDLRRTVGSWLAQSGHSLHLIGRVLNHSSPSTTAGYARFLQDHVKNALEQHGSKIVELIGKTPMGEVIPLKKIA